MSIIKLQEDIGTMEKVEEKPQPSLIAKEAKTEYYHFGEKVRIGSRKIVIQQVPKFSLLPKGPEAKSLRAEQVKKIGSQWARNSRDIIRGLNENEELYYLPKIIGVSPNSPDWNDRSLQYWADFGIEVPVDTGVELEIGFKEVSKGKTIPGSNAEPISLDGYIKYKFCQLNSDVATTEQELDNPYHKSFYVIDKAKQQLDDEQKFAINKEVNRLFDRLIASTDENDRAKIVYILELEGGEDSVGMNTTPLSNVQKEMELEKVKNKNPLRFKELITDPYLEIKALIRKSVEVGSLSQEGQAYFFDGKVIGNSLKETVAYLSNPANQQDKLVLVKRNENITI